MATNMKLWLPTTWYKLLLAASILLSAAGIVIAAVYNHVSDGGLGGAAAVALSFAALWVREDLSDRYARIMQRYPEEVSATGLAGEVEALRNKVADLEDALWLRSVESRRQNVTLALASVIGTISWALGEHTASILRRILF